MLAPNPAKEQAETMSPEVAAPRKIIHIDMDAFYAAVEQRDNPELRGKPVAVGGSHARGVVAAASYEARKFGVHSAMASITAKRKCLELIFVKPRFDMYRAISLQIREIFAEYTPIIEPLSLDEAYLDVTENPKGIASATWIAQKSAPGSALKSSSRHRPGFPTTSSSPSWLPTTANLMGFSVFVEMLPVRKFHGVGPATARKMEPLGIKTGLDLRAMSLAFLQRHFGKAGSYFYWAARGIDHRPVRPDRVRKSIGAENTFAADLFSYETACEALRDIIEKVWGYCDHSGTRGRTVTLKVKFANFHQITRSRTSQIPIGTQSELEQLANGLLEAVFPVTRGIRLLGISLSSLGTEKPQHERELRLTL
jgi:DNA polymerase IV